VPCHHEIKYAGGRQEENLKLGLPTIPGPRHSKGGDSLFIASLSQGVLFARAIDGFHDLIHQVGFVGHDTQ